MKMKKTLMATVAAAAVVGLTSMAAAQGTVEKGPAKPAAPVQGQKTAPGATLQRPQGAVEPPAHAAQGAKPEQRLGQEQNNGVNPQRGAQEERATPEKGAQERSPQQNSAQEKAGSPQRDSQEESGKSGAGTNTQHANESRDSSKGSRGAPVQLSEAQRTKIEGIIGKGDTARVTTNVNFNIKVGATIPRSVHVAALPEDVVEIVPQYEGFDYVVVSDEILIVDPDSLAIVAVIET
jgi:hypothetical protein